MTFGGNVSNVYTLAHELGHAYHQYVMEELPRFSQDYAMNVAETASTFAEMILADAFVKNAADDQQKIVLLADKVQNSISFFMNIHARFLFETRFYEKRRQGFLDAAELCELMEEAQREAFQGRWAAITRISGHPSCISISQMCLSIISLTPLGTCSAPEFMRKRCVKAQALRRNMMRCCKTPAG